MQVINSSLVDLGVVEGKWRAGASLLSTSPSVTGLNSPPFQIRQVVHVTVGWNLMDLGISEITYEAWVKTSHAYI